MQQNASGLWKILRPIRFYHGKMSDQRISSKSQHIPGVSVLVSLTDLLITKPLALVLLLLISTLDNKASTQWTVFSSKWMIQGQANVKDYIIALNVMFIKWKPRNFWPDELTK